MIFFLGCPRTKTIKRLTLQEKQTILRYSDDNPTVTNRDLALYFSNILGKSVSSDVIIRTFKNRDKILSNSNVQVKNMKSSTETGLMNEIFNSIKNRGTILTIKNITAIALELARDPKYGGFFARHKFEDKWVRNFTRIFNLKLNYAAEAQQKLLARIQK